MTHSDALTKYAKMLFTTDTPIVIKKLLIFQCTENAALKVSLWFIFLILSGYLLNTTLPGDKPQCAQLHFFTPKSEVRADEYPSV
jgi:hypothetical protein